MPTVLRSGPYRFYFYSNEPLEPPHVHIDRERFPVKLWLDPVDVARNDGFSWVEVGRIEAIVAANVDQPLEAWHEFMGA